MGIENDFLNAVQKLSREIEEHYKPYEDEDKRIISDGLVNGQEYNNSAIKILWILKEPYDLDNEGEGGWSLTERLNDENKLETLGGFKSTWYPIIYTSYSILNSFVKYEDMNNIENDFSMLNVLKSIAVINVQKFAANTTTNDNDIKSAYKQHSRILLKQILTYDPQIVIGGNVLWNFVDDLGLKDYHQYDEFDYWIKHDKLYINASHPSTRGGNEIKEAYVNDISRIAKRYYQQLKKS